MNLEKNSLGKKYKFFKISQKLGISHPEIKPSKYPKTLAEHDRIMKIVWDQLNWTWIET